MAPLPSAAQSISSVALVSGSESITLSGPATEPPCVRSDKLLGGGRELHIDHNGARYRLRVTASGKLILTK